MLEEVEPTAEVAEAQRSRSLRRSEAFARWLHSRYVPVELPSAEAYRFATQYRVKASRNGGR